MLRKLMVILCLLAVVMGAVMSVSASTTAPAEDFRVGFSRVDINPYVVDGDINSGIMELPLRGVGDVWNRLSTQGLVDDNGDGKIDEEDGLAVTCIAVTDEAGNTVLFMTVDLIGGNLAERIRTEICSRLEALQASGELQDVVLDPERIHYAGTHTHTAPDVTVYNANGKTGTNNDGKPLDEINTNLGIWIERTVEDAVDAAIFALKDRAPAKVTKDVLSAAEATSEPVKGKIMNSVRHYVAEDKGCVAGDNFNNRGSDPKQITQVNDNMYLLKFDFSDSDKLPVLLVNWRGHPSLNNSNDYPNSGRNCMSSDYPNSFRYTLEYNCTVNVDGSIQSDGIQDYRVAFFNGEGGNVNPRGREVEDGVLVGAWIDNLAKAQADSRGNVYGRVLAAMAQECLATEENRQSVRAGEIRNVQYVYNCVRRSTNISALAYEAAQAYQAEAAIKTVSHPYRYENEAGEIFVIGSKFQAANIISYWQVRFQAPKDDLVSMELNAIMLGDDVAFVTVPGEPFDYYYNEDGSNAWKNIIGDQYGTPFVLGYCNAAKGYIPNSKAYDYNLGSTKWQRGSYEAAITPFPQGAGEHMIELFGLMLDALAEGHSTQKENYCQHCKSVVTWKAYNGVGTLYTGHYYLLEDTMAPQLHIGEGQSVCFDLNGKTVKGETRAFYTKSKGGATLNLMDNTPEQKGAALGCGGPIGAAAGYGGGAIIVDSTNTFNFYSGNLGTYDRLYHSVHRGAVVRNSGTVNMYGGKILGATASSFTGDYVTSGNALIPTVKTGMAAAVYNTGTFHMYGGTIQAGNLETITGFATLLPSGKYAYSESRLPAEGKSVCVYTSGKFYVSGDAVVADLSIDDAAGKLFIVDNKSVPFTGSVQLSFQKLLGSSMQVGTTTGSEPLAEGAVTVADSIGLRQSGERLYVSAASVLTDSSGDFHYFDSMAVAYDAYLAKTTTDGTVRLLVDTAQSLYITKPLCLDLNGFYASGKLTVADGVTLFGKDSQTDDYTIEDELAYGKMTNIVCEGSGRVEGLSDGNVHYLKIKENNGISFHKVDLGIKSMSLRPGCVGVYYSCDFSGDELVAERVKSFGIALGIEDGNALLCDYSKNNQFLPGAGGNAAFSHGTLLTGIMKTTNTEEVNLQNALLPVYGRAYLQTEDGVIFGEGVTRSLQEQLVAIDASWKKLSDVQKQSVLQLYETYASVLQNWELPNMQAAIQN